MRIEKLTALAFGPFKGASLEFSPHLTVIYGPNESGKSSWHAALYAGLCGMRRAKGAPRAEDKHFAGLRRPWAGDLWQVLAIVKLDDGRRVEIRQNLADLADCAATDADFGRDLSSEILNEGTPDASLWLGLDRESFLSVACVRQGELLRVVHDVESLQDVLQRATTSAARDATAAGAIGALEDFLREHVGREQVNSTKPLQRVKTGFAIAERNLADAQTQHADWLSLQARALELQALARQREGERSMFVALRARKEAESWQVKVTRARKLSQRFLAGAPRALTDDEAFAGIVAKALSDWGNRPTLTELTGEPAVAIRKRLDALPSMPAGDREVHADVAKSREGYQRATQALELHDAQQPGKVESAGAGAATPDQLRDWGRLLSIPVPLVDSQLEAERAEADDTYETAGRASSKRPWLMGGALACVVAGAGLGVFVSAGLGIALGASGVAALTWLALRSDEAGRARAAERIRTIDAQLVAQRRTRADAIKKTGAIRTSLEALGLPADSKRLGELADDLVVVDERRRALVDWTSKQEQLMALQAASRSDFEQALRFRGCTHVTDPLAAYATYERECLVRYDLATRAEKRAALEQQLADREAAEVAARDAQSRWSNAKELLLATAGRCGHDGTDVDSAIASLKTWQSSRSQALSRFDEATREYAELTALLDGKTLEQLEQQMDEHTKGSAALAIEVATMPGLDGEEDLAQASQQAEAQAQSASQAATVAETRAVGFASHLPSVAEAEEAVASIREELGRVTRLSQTLNHALDFLRRAEEQVHRDIAPILAGGLRRWLPSVTNDRYTDARVDPSDLNVQVYGPEGQWRDADALSQGTTEQLYLLLRIVLAEHIATTGETCPLILDDVLVHCDRARKRALLTTISAASSTRQVILFTQEEEVLQWAQESVGPTHRLVVLPGAV